MRTALIQERLCWPYDDALRWMEETRASVIAGGPMVLGVGSHAEEVITLGRHAPEDQVLAREALAGRGALLRRVERGGGATAHGPGQVVLYPIVSLRALELDVPGLTCVLEESVTCVLSDFGIASRADPVDRGVYVDGAKVASIGFRVSQGVVTHGVALNVDNDLSLFSLIAPCGQAGRAMTSMAEQLGAARVDVGEVARCLTSHVSRMCMLESQL